MLPVRAASILLAACGSSPSFFSTSRAVWPYRAAVETLKLMGDGLMTDLKTHHAFRAHAQAMVVKSEKFLFKMVLLSGYYLW